MGAPWLGFANVCDWTGKRDVRDWFAKMAEARKVRGQGPWGQWGFFGGPPPFPPPPWFGGGAWRMSKARRGDVRAAILAVLAEQPMNGYQLIQEIAARSGGGWKPSPGSIYPTLQQLEDEGLVSAEVDGGRRVFSLTDQGRTYVAEHADEVEAPWQDFTEKGSGGRFGPGDGSETKPLIGQIAAAVWQIMAVGTPEQQAKGREALVELRRKLYSILAEDESEGETGRESSI
jgi:DNA-binding PadR family transcriptional regulator